MCQTYHVVTSQESPTLSLSSRLPSGKFVSSPPPPRWLGACRRLERGGGRRLFSSVPSVELSGGLRVEVFPFDPWSGQRCFVHELTSNVLSP